MPTSALQAFVSLYHELTKVGCPPPVAKKMEVWEAASALGAGWETVEDSTRPQSGPSRSDLEVMQQRLLASKGLAEKPQAKATNPDDINAMMSVFSSPR